MKKIFCVILTCLIGCVGPTPHDLTKEIEKVKQVTLEDLSKHALSLETHYEEYAQVEGIIWPPKRISPPSDFNIENPNGYGNGGDTALFQGYVLATTMYRYTAYKSNINMDYITKALRGLHILTHISGTPGVIARCALPLDSANKWGYPASWGRRIARGFVGESKENTITDPLTSNGAKKYYPAMAYYTRATRDQLTGILFGLSVAWKNLDGVSPNHVENAKMLKKVISQIVEDIYTHLKKHDFLIRDENGRNDTNSDNVTGILKTQLYALYRLTARPDRQERIQKKYEESFRSAFKLNRFWDFVNVFNNYDQYYAWNLRYARAYSIWLLEDSIDRVDTVKNYVKDNLWAYTSGQKCPFFTYIYSAMAYPSYQNHQKTMEEALFSLKSLSLKPIRQLDSPLATDIRAPTFFQAAFGSIDEYVVLPHLLKPTDYFTWTKKPWDVGKFKWGSNPPGDTTGLDFLLPYWMGRHYGFIN